MQMLRDAPFRQTLINEADVHGTRIDLEQLFMLPPGGTPATTAIRRIRWRRSPSPAGVSPAAAFIELALETDGHVVASMPFLNQDLAAVEQMLDDPLVTLGLADAGAHVGQIMDASQPTFFLTYWIANASVGASRRRSVASRPTPPTCSGSGSGAGWWRATSPT